MSTKRYLLAVDRNEGGQLFKRDQRMEARTWADLIPHEHNGGGRLFEIDLALAFEVTEREPTDHDRYEFAESDLLRATIEEARLRPVTRGEPVLPESMCDVSQLKRTYEAAKEWKRWIDDGTGKMPDVGNALYDALAALFPDIARGKERAG